MPKIETCPTCGQPLPRNPSVNKSRPVYAETRAPWESVAAYEARKASGLRWDQAPNRLKAYQRHDCFADVDTGKTTNPYQKGRWLIKAVAGKDKHYALRWNGALVQRFQTVAEARKYAEAATNQCLKFRLYDC